jgi:hypothetical protein
MHVSVGFEPAVPVLERPLLSGQKNIRSIKENEVVYDFCELLPQLFWLYCYY